MTKRQTCFRLSEEDSARLDAIKEHLGVESRSAALRAALRWYKRTQLEKGPRVHYNSRSRPQVGDRIACGRQQGGDTKVTGNVAEVTCQRCKRQLEKA
jgi:hypothetical protein